MSKYKHIFCALIACVTLTALGGRMFAEEEPEYKRLFLSVIKVTSGSKDMGKRFSLVLDNPISQKKSTPQSVDGGEAQIIGEINKDTTFRVVYSFPDGKTLDIVKNMITSKQGKYPQFRFSPPVKLGDEKNEFLLTLTVYPDPDPEFEGKVQDALLEVNVVK